MFDEILDFAEIEEYIDQPMKTYSTGMCSRLMFASSIVMTPDILIVDEILGVGDAYFAHKSFERMRDLCRRGGTTLLLVTHDIYSALSLCDRFIWIDRGEVKFDGDGKSAIALYESSVKDQEENWLRQKNRASLAGADVENQTHVLVRSQTGFALHAPFAIDRIDLILDDESVSTLQVAAESDGWQSMPGGNLGPPQVVDGRLCRALESAGSIYHKAEWVANVPAARVRAVRIVWRYAGDDPVDVRVFEPGRRLVVAETVGRSVGWSERTFERTVVERSLDVAKQTSYGTGLARIADVQFLDAEGRNVVEVTHGAHLTVQLRVTMHPDLVDRAVTFIVGFSRSGTPYSGLVYRSPIQLPDGDECVIRVSMDDFPLGAGQWYVIAAVGEAGLYDKEFVKYFTTDASWHHMLAERLELSVLPTGKVQTFGCFALLRADVSVDR